MRRFKIIAITLGIVIFAIGLILFLVGYLKPKSAGLLIETNPQASVYINGFQVGRTPYETAKKAGEVVVKLIPDDSNLSPFETKVNLISGIKTVVKGEFGKTEESSSGAVTYFEKVGGEETILSAISTPDGSQITIDGQVKGFTPFQTSAISPGEHQLIFSADGYEEEAIFVLGVPGYRLTTVVKLAKSETEAVPTPQASPLVKEVFIEILETPNGFLRLRDGPSTDAQEIAKLSQGEKYKLLEEGADGAWFKIEYQESMGWVASEYVKRVEEP